MKALIPVTLGVTLGAPVPKTIDPQALPVALGGSAPLKHLAHPVHPVHPVHEPVSAPKTASLPLHDSGPKPAVHDAGAAAKPTAVAVAPKSRAELRRLFLEQSAITLGQSWADQWRDDLRREGRPAAGGWPGTLREARVRVEHHLLAEVIRRKMSAVTEAEREVAARKAYASARAQWCRQAEPEAP